MKHFLHFIALLFLISGYAVFGQDGNNARFNYTYTTILLDSTIAQRENVLMKSLIDSLQKQLDDKMNVVIGKSSATLTSFSPSSPLSNLLTDMLFHYGNAYSVQHDGIPADMSLLNFGGICSSIPQGDITVGTLYNVLPFDSTMVVIISLKGSELTKVFQRFTDRKNQPYSQLQIRYHNLKPFQILLNNEKIEDDRLYRLVTIGFIADGGDQILTDISFENIIHTDALLRDVIIDEIKQVTASGKSLELIDDDRVLIDIQYRQ